MRGLAVFLALTAGAAQAACPGAGDLDTGIRMVGSDGSTDTYLREPGGLVRGIYSDGGSRGSKYLLMRGIYMVEIFDTENGSPVAGSRSTYAYPVTAETAPMPTPGGRWDTLVTILDRGELKSHTESFVFGDATRVTLGACGYDMLPITAIYHNEDGYQERLHYLPELGFAYLAATQERGQAADPVVYIAIERVAP
ncbi:MAG: hypothetical protein O2898_04145 [Proteobacteria bacterium]|nr:hypothetical protein [Pseudomonadota bacterium]